jgi:CBS domain-containing protein
MVKVKIAEPGEEDVDQRGRTRTEAGSHAKTLPENIISRLPVRDLDGRRFRGLLSRTAVHIVSGMGKTR